MRCYIDGNYRSEQNFWRELQGIASPTQKQRIMEGLKVIIGGRCYYIIFEEPDNMQI